MPINLTHLINHPEELDRDTLYELRSLIALYPFFQTARLLMLRNLFLLHDPTFDEELRRAAIYIGDRRVLFQMVEAAHYQLRREPVQTARRNADRTLSLIDDFLGTIPADTTPKQGNKRRPTPADATVDYVAYLLENEEAAQGDAPQMKGQDLIDNFIENENGKIRLSDTESSPAQPEQAATEESQKDTDESYFTETLARIYIKQGRYSKALEIIKRLSLNIPKKNAYFADQIRFLEKLIINENNKR